MKRILAQCTKELVQFRRDRLTLALAFLLPFITLLVFGFAIRLESKDIPLIVQDFDRTNLSSSYIERLYATNQFIPKQWTGSDPTRDAIDKGIAKAAVIIPPNFSSDLKAGRNTKLQVLIDATDVNNARVIRNSIQAVTNFFMQQDPLRHYITIVRGILLKGVGIEVLWIHVLALIGFAVVLMTISIRKFRNQLS